MTRPTVICSAYDVVVVPFPFTDRVAVKRRPALAISTERFGTESNHTVLAMITSAKNPAWPLDVTIDATRAGLHAASKVRMKLFTLDNRLILRKTGSLSDEDKHTVRNTVQQMLGA